MWRGRYSRDHSRPVVPGGKQELDAAAGGHACESRTRSVANTSLYCRDYKPVNGWMVPYVLETKVQAVKQSHKMTIESLVMNPKLDDSLFAVPKIQ